MVFLDTSFLIDLAHDVQSARGRLDGLVETHTAYSVPAPVYFKLHADLSPKGPRSLRFFRQLERYSETPLTRKDAEAAAEIEKELAAAGLTIGTVDLLIAGMCRSHRERLLTADPDFKNVRGLKVDVYR
ncbi:MAG TPA: PIN domain-containing protein [Thermoplasmata archaeon]|nr:PIN domain-containing protein [Thermoplasmata archaeon]